MTFDFGIAARCDNSDGETPPGRCARCGYVRQLLPSWAKPGAVFGVRGKTFRIVNIGSTNQRISMHAHFEDYVTAQIIEDEEWALPRAPTAKAELSGSLSALFGLPKFYAEDLEHVLRAA